MLASNIPIILCVPTVCYCTFSIMSNENIIIARSKVTEAVKIELKRVVMVVISKILQKN